VGEQFPQRDRLLRPMQQEATAFTLSSSTSISIAVPAKGFDMEAIQKTASGRIGRRAAKSEYPAVSTASGPSVEATIPTTPATSPRSTKSWSKSGMVGKGPRTGGSKGIIDQHALGVVNMTRFMQLKNTMNENIPTTRPACRGGKNEGGPAESCHQRAAIAPRCKGRSAASCACHSE